MVGGAAPLREPRAVAQSQASCARLGAQLVTTPHVRLRRLARPRRLQEEAVGAEGRVRGVLTRPVPPLVVAAV